MFNDDEPRALVTLAQLKDKDVYVLLPQEFVKGYKPAPNSFGFPVLEFDMEAIGRHNLDYCIYIAHCHRCLVKIQPWRGRNAHVRTLPLPRWRWQLQCLISWWNDRRHK